MGKQRVSLTIDEDVLARVDRRLASEGFENRSQGIQAFLEAYLAQGQIRTGVILAGGGDDPNALIHINGRPVLEHNLDFLADAGIETVYVTANREDVLQDVTVPTGLSVEVLVEDTPRGTAGSLRPLQGQVSDTFLVMNGDILCDIDITDMRQVHGDTEGTATMGLTTVRESADYGVVQMKGNQIVGFAEKPDETVSHLINAGVYLLDPVFLDHIPDQAEQQTVAIETLFEDLAENRLLHGYVHDGDWQEVG